MTRYENLGQFKSWSLPNLGLRTPSAQLLPGGFAPVLYLNNQKKDVWSVIFEPIVQLIKKAIQYLVCDNMGIPRCCGRSPHGERGLKLAILVDEYSAISRSPHGERGLKHIRTEIERLRRDLVAPPTGSVD